MTDHHPLRVGLSATVLARGLANNAVDGIGTCTQALIEQFALNPDVVTTLYAHSMPERPATLCGQPLRDAGGFRRQSIPALTLGTSFQQTARAVADCEVVHASDHFVPRLKDTPVVATLMDAIPLAHPEWVGYPFKHVLNALWRRSFHWADHLITISAFSKAEIVHWFGIRPEQITVIPLGVDGAWFTPPDATAIASVRAALQLPERFFLFVGTLQPRKNLGRLLAAHAQLPIATQREYPLVVAGRAGWQCEADIAAMQARPDTVRWLARVDDASLKVLMHQATAFVFPSLYEGFGLPILEALACGTPVLAADSTSIPEVCQPLGHDDPNDRHDRNRHDTDRGTNNSGDQPNARAIATLFDPTDTDAIEAALRDAIDVDASAAEDHRERRRAHARTFSWAETAARTVAVYRSVV